MTAELQPFEVVKTVALSGPAPVLFLCEHASAQFPAALGDLGIDAAVRASHVAWDPGALDLAARLSEAFGAPLVHGGISRLYYDCNRPPEAVDSIPAKSEVFEIPGNAGLTQAQRDARRDEIYLPFCAAVDAAIETAQPAAIVTIHSFTPIYFGRPRAVEIGILHDSDARLADAMLAQDWQGRDVRRNDPYGPEDGVTHSLKRHAVTRGLLNVMIEVRNDLLADPAAAENVFALLSRNLSRALAETGVAEKEPS